MTSLILPVKLISNLVKYKHLLKYLKRKFLFNPRNLKEKSVSSVGIYLGVTVRSSRSFNFTTFLENSRITPTLQFGYGRLIHNDAFLVNWLWKCIFYDDLYVKGILWFASFAIITNEKISINEFKT